MSTPPPTGSPSDLPRTVGELLALFLAFMVKEEAQGRYAPRTVAYYREWLGRWVALVGADLPLSSVIGYHLEAHKTGWHSIQSVKRLFHWAARVGLVASNPMARVELPPKGGRELVLSRAEMARLRRAAEPAFRAFLGAMQWTIARPQEIRALVWSDLRKFDVGAAFCQKEFKGKAKRRDGVRLRIIPVNARLMRLLDRLRLRRPGLALWEFGDSHVFRNSEGRPWTPNAVRCCFRRLRVKCGMEAGEGEEAVVTYSFRHSAATLAAAAGTTDRILASIMGHSSTRTTARYLHLRPEDVAPHIDAATRRQHRPPEPPK